MTIQALGSDVTVVVSSQSQDNPDELFQNLALSVYEFERRCSRFLPASELSQLNQSAGRAYDVSDELLDVIRSARMMNLLTDGLYNPMLLPAVQRSGYLDSAVEGHETDANDDYRSRVVCSMDKVLIRGSTVTLPYNTALDLGGCGKGYIADRLADELDRRNFPGYWVSLGGDMVTYGVSTDGSPWKTTVQSADSRNEEAPLYIQTDGSRAAIATSGTFRRAVHASSDGRWHHIIDPRTLAPAETDVRLATVVDRLALRADVLASCAVIVGSDAAASYVERRGSTGVIVQASAADDDEIFTISKGAYIHNLERSAYA